MEMNGIKLAGQIENQKVKPTYLMFCPLRSIVSSCRYFALVSACCAVVLGTLGSMESNVSNLVTNTVILGLATALSNLIFIEPKVTAVLFQRYDLENSGKADAEQRKKLTKSFGAPRSFVE
jgi:hypothetical protein